MIVLISSISTNTQQIRRQQQLQSCYNDFSTVILKEAEKQICVVLDSADNRRCNKLPRGIQLQIKVDKLGSSFTPTGYFTDFSYASTTELCVSCTNPLCQSRKFFESLTASATISSYALTAQVLVGAVIRQQLDLQYCIQNSYLNVFSDHVESVVQIQSTCAFPAINASSSVQFTNTALHFTHNTPVISGNLFIMPFSTSALSLFDENNFQSLRVRLCFQRGSTVNCVQRDSSDVRIHGLPPGFAKLSLKMNSGLKLVGIPSLVGKGYQSLMADSTFRVKLQVNVNNKSFIFESTDKVTYTPGETQNFTCSTDVCGQNMQYVHQNNGLITSAHTVTTVKKNGLVTFVVSENVTSINEGCYQGFHLNYNEKFMWLDLLSNQQSTVCQISSNQNYTLVLSAKNQTQTNITQFSYQLNSTANMVNISFAVRSEILQMINNQFISLQILQDTETIDNIPLLKVVNHCLEDFRIQQTIILVISMVISILLTIIFYDAKYYCNRSAKQTTKMSKIILLKFNEFDDIE
ncbi:Conserved_hypothetical protein [Hexamita inflata]|uniref:Uncharacterized protein n=1 Tax=Hexamita inflata TaxID=28002 RepID=A0AA86QHU0_9EUKA|nr:Conserved hypothetical protein [Hexamita inflata]